MPRRGENIYKRKDGRWEGRYMKQRSLDGKANYGYVYGKSYKEAKRKLSDAVNAERLFMQRKNNHSGEYASFEDVANDWIASIEPRIKLSTIAKYKNLLNSYIYPEFSDYAIDDITCNHVDTYCNELLVAGGCTKNGLSPKTVSDVLSLIKNIMRFAKNKGFPIKNDINPISVKQYPKEMRVLSLYEQQRLCQYLYSDLTLCNLGILVCLFTGLRVGEICALKWEDISFEEHTLFVHQTMQRVQVNDCREGKTKILISTPKSNCSIRRIPLPNDLCKTLLKFKQPPQTFFLTGNEQKYLEPRSMQHRFKTVLKRSSIDDANFHSLRHTFATRCVELGFDIKSLSEILGHANVNITLNRYVHPSMKLKHENMQKLDTLFSVN